MESYNSMWNQEIAFLKELIEKYGVAVVLKTVASIIENSL